MKKCYASLAYLAKEKSNRKQLLEVASNLGRRRITSRKKNAIFLSTPKE